MSPVKSFISLILLFSVAIPLMGFPDVIFPDHDDSFYRCTAVTGGIILIGGFIVLSYREYSKLKIEIHKIERTISSKYEIIVTGSIRFDISFFGFLTWWHPAVLAFSAIRGYQLFAMIEGDIKVRNLNGAKISLRRSNMSRDNTKYIEFITAQGVVYFAPYTSLYIFRQNKYAESIVRQIRDSEKSIYPADSRK